ncbi:hypothetical protein BKA81DRAFT_357075 [Phyllosticta paracitricarpa]
MMLARGWRGGVKKGYLGSLRYRQTDRQASKQRAGGAARGPTRHPSPSPIDSLCS